MALLIVWAWSVGYQVVWLAVTWAGALALGQPVREVQCGLGPALVLGRVGPTALKLGAIPLGAYVAPRDEPTGRFMVVGPLAHGLLVALGIALGGGEALRATLRWAGALLLFQDPAVGGPWLALLSAGGWLQESPWRLAAASVAAALSGINVITALPALASLLWPRAALALSLPFLWWGIALVVGLVRDLLR